MKKTNTRVCAKGETLACKNLLRFSNAADRRASKQREQRRRSRRESAATHLLDPVLLLVQRDAVQLQQRGADAHGQVVRVHLVGVGALQDVVQDAEQVLQEDPVGPGELVEHPFAKKKRRKAES